MRVEYPRSSPYGVTGQSSWFLSNYKHRSISPDSRDRQVVLDSSHEFRPDKLSQELYGTSAYWWVFMVRNMSQIRDPIGDFKAGLTIWVPAADHLKKSLEG
jgi:hypothetical protein